MLNINLSTPSSVLDELKYRYKEKRLELDLTQEGLANKSGVSLGSLKRFETSGQIALESLLKLSLVLECLEDFKQILTPKKQIINSIDELLEKRESSKKRGSIK
ncbi:MAG: helix-turn-helix transcriptional regulator [Sulfurimonas sp.]|jgi:transcriptional regulator with XRE-family HTH domain|nr:helix-turn-helix transcriptional regulator [Sulfurimonas sp.]